MKVREIVATLNLEVINEGEHLEDEVVGGYVGDLLSDVIASAKERFIWVTIQVHENIIAVATLKDLSAIILAKNSTPLDETLENAREEGVTLLKSSMDSFGIVSALSERGITGGS